MVHLSTEMMLNGMRHRMLESDGIKPLIGPPGTEHSFFVTYEDEANQAPTSVKLYLDDKIYDMMPVDRKATFTPRA